ncbi:MAG: hypothetical protein ACRDZW_01245 [Acidimicrobiales bacterium]
MWGQLGGMAEDGWGGHRIWVGFEERDGCSSATPRWVAAARQCGVDPDGRFSVDLPPLQEVRGPVSVAVVAPDWSVISRQTLVLADLERPLVMVEFNRDDVVARRRAIRQARGLGIPA